MSAVKNIFNKLGIDEAIKFTSLFRLLQASGGLISILFVANYLTDIEQGYYYTFISLTALQIFFELGLNTIITQYVAHEFSHLKWVNEYTITGEDKYLSRLSSLLHFCLKWYILFSLLLLVGLICVGFYFFNDFSNSGENINWTSPWVLLSFFTALNLLITPIFGFIQGLGKVKEVAQIRLIQQSIVYIGIYCGFILGFKLFVPAIQSAILVILGFTLIFIFKFHKILISLWKYPRSQSVSYSKEIFPFQWKIAISWISGYFIYQIFNPILFMFEGPVIAGKMGMTLAILNGVQALSNSWMSTKIPIYSGLIAQKQFKKLDILFDKTLKQTIFVIIFLLTILFITILLIKYLSINIFGINIGERVIRNVPLLFMMLTIILNQFTFSWAVYLRCHKKEPFLLYSIVMAILTLASTYLLTKFHGVIGMTFGYFIITASMFYWANYIFKNKKNEWH